jgi:hypothetical protein
MAGNITTLGKSKLLVISIIEIKTLQQIAGDFQVYTRIADIRKTLPQMAARVIAVTRSNVGLLDKLAVVPVQLQGGGNGQTADTLAQILAIHLIRSGKYTIYPRTKSLEQVQDEYDNQHREAAEKNAIGIGHGDNPHLVLSVAARTLGAVNMFNASIIDLVNGTQAVGSSAEYSGIEDGMRAMESLAQALAGSAKKVPITQRPRQEFSGGRRFSAGVLNLALGIGSFSMGDWGGGLTLAAGYAVAGGLIAYELVGLTYEDPLAGALGPIGVGVAGLTAVYGFIRPFIYHKSTRTTLVDVLDRVHIAIIPDTAGIQAVGLSYIYQY